METKYFSAYTATTTRRKTNGTESQGSGRSKRLYVGVYEGRNYYSYVKFTFDWTNVDKLSSAYLVAYTDNYDAFGSEFPLPAATATPKGYLRRLVTAFTDGSTDDGSWSSSNWTAPTNTVAGARNISPPAAAQELFRVDVTDIVEDWMPSSIRRHDSGVGAGATNHGIMFWGTSNTAEKFSFCSETWDDASLRVKLEINYELGNTSPDAPTNLTPTGTVTGLASFQGDFTDLNPDDYMTHSAVEVFGGANSISSIGTDDVINDAGHGRYDGDIIYFTSLTGGVGLSTFTAYYVVSSNRTAGTFKVSTTKGGSPVNVTTAYTAGTWRIREYSRAIQVSNTERTNGRFDHVPNVAVRRNRSLSWRARVRDNDGIWSAWTSLVDFTVTNSAPTATQTQPADAASFASLSNVIFKGSMTDPESDTMLAYQVQLSAYAAGAPQWDDSQYIKWDTGKRYVAPSTTYWTTGYGGEGLAAGTYYWRARVWDEYDNVSEWVTRQIVVSASFVAAVEDAGTSFQPRPRAPWRIVIKDMGALRGPGDTVAILENAKSVGASIMYNSPGEAHWTLAVDHPQISVIEPKQTHYSIQFYDGDGWREKFAGLVWDFDANERDVVFYGIDYLALYDYVMDERYDPANPDKPYTAGGSKYVDVTISTVFTSIIDHVKSYTNSPVGFITRGSIATMDEKVTLWTTFMPTLQMLTGLLESHKGGADKRTRVMVRPKTGGGYEIVVVDNPGVVRNNLRMKYGELVQGYRVIAFGNSWATRMNVIGRTRNGLKVHYEREVGPLDESTWGRFAQATILSDVDDRLDLKRRARQLAYQAGVLGNQLGLGLRTGLIGPRDGYDVTDQFPVSVVHGAVNTDNFGHDGLWVCLGVAWEGSDNGDQSVVLSLRPPTSGSAPSDSLLDSLEISPQAEWQVGWTSPDVVRPRSRYWLNQTTGKVYIRNGYGTVKPITGTA